MNQWSQSQYKGITIVRIIELQQINAIEQDCTSLSVIIELHLKMCDIDGLHLWCDSNNITSLTSAIEWLCLL